ncbi:MAG: hypothetical protein ACQET7_09535 [Thermodesulfobacteriota bacterium]
MNYAHQGTFRHFAFVSIVMSIFVFNPSGGLAEKAVENMELDALQGRAKQLTQRLDRDPADYGALLGLGVTYHAMALKDSKAYTGKAVRSLEEAYQKRPDDFTALCYLGSAYTLLAKDRWNPVSRLMYLNKGFKYMDKAVQKDPDNVTLRLVRANNSKAMPKFFERRSIAYEDFEHLAMVLERDDALPAKLAATVYRNLSELYADDGNRAEAKRYHALAERHGQEDRFGSD